MRGLPFLFCAIWFCNFGDQLDVDLGLVRVPEHQGGPDTSGRTVAAGGIVMMLLYSLGVVYCPKVGREYTLFLCGLFVLDDEAALCSFKEFDTGSFGGSGPSFNISI